MARVALACTVDGCEGKYHAKGFCAKHYWNFKRNGSPLFEYTRGNAPARFWEKVKKTEGCWLWLGGIMNHGYGTFSINRQTIKAHRYSYELAYGAIPEHDSAHGLCVCHICDNRACVNPTYLFLGTHADNMRDMNDKGRGVKLKGTLNPKSTLTEAQVLEIRSLVLAGSSRRELGMRFGVGYSTISKIVLRETWKHI